MAASKSSVGLSASVLLTADHPLRRRFVGSFHFPVQQRNAPALAVRAASSSSSEPSAASGTRTGRGITKPRPVSPAMQALVGVPEIPRTQALKLIWAYIKEHNLQDPQDKKIIICDEKLKAIFGGRDRVGFLEIAGLINPHFLKRRVPQTPSIHTSQDEDLVPICQVLNEDYLFFNGSMTSHLDAYLRGPNDIHFSA